MKAKYLLLSAALLALAPALHGSDKNPADYPVKLVVLSTHTWTNRWGVHGRGRGRINDGGQVNGIEFTYDCGERLMASYGGEAYLAKWKNGPNELTVLSHNIGETHENTCDLKVEVHNFIYVRKNGTLDTVSQKQWAETHAAGASQQDDDDTPVPGGEEQPPQN